MKLATRVNVTIDGIVDVEAPHVSVEALKSGVESELKEMYPDANITATVISWRSYNERVNQCRDQR